MAARMSDIAHSPTAPTPTHPQCGQDGNRAPLLTNTAYGSREYDLEGNVWSFDTYRTAVNE